MLEEKMLYVRKKSAKIYGHRGFSLDNQNLCWAKSISWKLFLLLHFSCCSCFSLSASVFLMFVHSTLWIFRPLSFEELCRARASKKGSNKNTTSDTYKYSISEFTEIAEKIRLIVILYKSSSTEQHNKQQPREMMENNIYFQSSLLVLVLPQ